MNPIRRQKEFKRAIRFDDHFNIEESDGFVKVLYRASTGWEIWSVLQRSDFDQLLEDSLQNEKAQFLNELIKNDIKDIR